MTTNGAANPAPSLLLQRHVRWHRAHLCVTLSHNETLGFTRALSQTGVAENPLRKILIHKRVFPLAS